MGRDISYRRARWFYERHMGYETTEHEDDLFPKKTEHPLLNRQRAYHMQKREERENEKREKYESGYETTEHEDDLFPKKTEHPLLNRQRAYHMQKREERENEKREKYESGYETTEH